MLEAGLVTGYSFFTNILSHSTVKGLFGGMRARKRPLRPIPAGRSLADAGRGGARQARPGTLRALDKANLFE